MEVYLQIAFLEEFMKKLSTVITAFLICAAVFASTTQFNQKRAECVEPHEHCSEGLACDELCQEELGLAGQILVANQNKRWVCIRCGQTRYSPHRPAPGQCFKTKDRKGAHSWVRD